MSYAQVRDEIPFETPETPKQQKQVYIINGSGGVGKDAFISLVEEYIGSEHAFKDSYVRLAKYMLEQSDIKVDYKNEKVRKLLADMTKLLEEFGDFPMADVQSGYECFLDCEACAMFIAIRDPKQIKRAVEMFDAKTILVTNKYVEPITSNEADAHVADYDYDIYIKNDGTLDELREAAYEFCIDQGLLEA